MGYHHDIIACCSMLAAAGDLFSGCYWYKLVLYKTLYYSASKRMFVSVHHAPPNHSDLTFSFTLHLVWYVSYIGTCFHIPYLYLDSVMSSATCKTCNTLTQTVHRRSDLNRSWGHLFSRNNNYTICLVNRKSRTIEVTSFFN